MIESDVFKNVIGLIAVALFVYVYTGTAVANDASLPALPELGDDLASQSSVFVREIVFEGNTVFSDEVLTNEIASYLNRDVTAAELFEIRNIVSRFYANRGYINSGAVLPNQRADNGIVVFEIVEGTLTTIEITGNKRLRDRYIRSRIEDGVQLPLNVHDLQQPLRLLHNDDVIERINSQLRPGTSAGESVLQVTVEESRPYQLGLGVNNHRSPSIGSYRGEVAGAVRNVTGWGDEIGASYGLTEGLDDYGVYYAIPLNRHDTTLSISYDNNDSRVVSHDFADLDIESQTDTLSIGVRQPMVRTPSREIAISLQFQKKKNETSLLGLPFAFLGQGENDDISRTSVFSFGQEWIERSTTRVVTARSTLSAGVDWLDATVDEAQGPDGRFFTWLGQFQWLQQVPYRNSQLLLRTDLRISDSSLLPLERFSIGGHNTVRGYRENEITRDNGFVLGLEYQVPVATLKLPGISSGPLDGQIHCSVFGDYGRGWNRNTGTPDPQDLSSVGIGVKWYAGSRLRMEFYWGHALRNVDDDDEYDLQDDGFHFQISTNVF